jgi:beta-lactamase regulating signal transducer with metallopeptidase domain
VGPTHLILVPSAPDTLIAIVVGVWVAMALALLVRVLPGVHTIFRMRDRCSEFPPEVEAQLSLWVEAREQRPGRPAQLMLCDAVRGATVLGFHRSYIAVSPSLLTALTRDELDQIVLHEYAHVQRWDDWTRLAQAVVQSALWIHPAAAIIGRRLDLEREIACDEWVVSRTELPKLYARCLTRAAEVHGRIGMQVLLGPALFSRKRHLVLRVNRLLAARGRTRRHVSLIGALVGTCALAIFTLQVQAIPLVGEMVRISAVAQSSDADLSSFTPATRVARREPPNPRIRLRASRYGGQAAESTNRRTDDAAFARRATADKPTNPRTHEVVVHLAPDAPIAPIAPIAPDTSSTPALILARSFAGRYVAPEPSAALQDRSRPWEAAGEIGIEIGASARNGSVAIAKTFTRAGLSLARRF